MSKIIGIAQSKFKPDDSETFITGENIYVTDKLDPKRGEGESAERFFLTSTKLATLDFTPAVGQEVEVLYNRYGKVSTMRLLSDNDDGAVID